MGAGAHQLAAAFRSFGRREFAANCKQKGRLFQAALVTCSAFSFFVGYGL